MDKLKEKERRGWGKPIILFVYMLTRPPPPCSQVRAGHLDTKVLSQLLIPSPSPKGNPKIPQHTHNLDRGQGCSAPAQHSNREPIFLTR